MLLYNYLDIEYWRATARAKKSGSPQVFVSHCYSTVHGTRNVQSVFVQSSINDTAPGDSRTNPVHPKVVATRSTTNPTSPEVSTPLDLHDLARMFQKCSTTPQVRRLRTAICVYTRTRNITQNGPHTSAAKNIRTIKTQRLATCGRTPYTRRWWPRATPQILLILRYQRHWTYMTSYRCFRSAAPRHRSGV